MVEQGIRRVTVAATVRRLATGRAVRFALGSGTGLVVDLGVFAILTQLGLLAFVSSLLSTALAISVVYVLATRFAFRVAPSWRTYMAFFVWYASSALCVAAVVQLISNDDRLVALIAKLATVPFTFATNFVFGRWLFGGGAERLRVHLVSRPAVRDSGRTALEKLLSRPRAVRVRFLVAGIFTAAFVVLVLPMNLAISFSTPTDRRGLLLAHVLQIAFAGALFVSVLFVIRFVQALRLRSVTHRRWLAVAAAYLAINLVLFALIYPGFWVSDEYYTIAFAKQFSVYAWQGYLTTLFYTFGLFLGPSPIFIVLIQLLLIALIVGYVISELMARLSRPALGWLGILPLLAFPVLLNNQYPLRLTLYGYLMLLLIVRIGVVAQRHRSGGSRLQFVVLCGLVGVLAFWRSEGLFLLVLVPVCFVLTGTARRFRQSPGRSVLAMTVGVGVIAVIGGVTFATAPGGYQATAVLNPLSTMLQGDLKSPKLRQDLQTLNRTLDLDAVRKYPAWNETPSLFNGALRGGAEARTTSVFPAFLDLVVHNPGPFLDNRIRAFEAANSMQLDWVPQVTPMQVWQGDPMVATQAEQFYSTNSGVRPIAPAIKYPVEQALEFWTRQAGILPVGRIVWNALPQIAMTLLLGVVALVRRRWWWAFSAAIVLGNAAMVFLTEPASYFMYFFPAYLAGGALVAGAAILACDTVLGRIRRPSVVVTSNRSPVVTARPSILLVVPAYNCAPQVTRVLDAIEPELLARLDEVVVIDNRSQDDTVAAAESAGRRLGEKFKVWRNVENFGLGGTHKVAFDYAVDQGFDYVAILHGDDQADAREVVRLIDRAGTASSAAAILGARFLPRSRRIGYSKVRTAGNRAINAVFTLVAGRHTIDLGSGLNLFRVADLTDREYRTFDDGITFNIDLLLHYFARRSRLAYEPITWREEDQVSNARNVSVGTSALRKLFRWRFGMRTSGAEIRAYRFEVVS